MKCILTSCGLETQAITDAFLSLLPKAPQYVRALFIPTAAVDPDAIEVLPKCLNDLLKCGIPRANITVYDLHDPMPGPLADRFDVVYLCGGRTSYLLRRINEQGFREKLLRFISDGGVVLGVSAGSLIFAANLPDNLALLACPLDVHCPDDSRERPGRYPVSREERIHLGNRQAILCDGNDLTILE